jgi:serine/threonine protein kinase
MADHPNIVKMYEVVVDSRNFHLVMEHCEGGELFDYIVE